MLIHIGYHKTATTWLQQVYFPHHTDLAFVAGHEELSPRLMLPHGLDFSAEEARAFFLPLVGQAERAGKLAVISAERLSGNPHSGGYDSKDLADRLRAVFGEAKILIVVRQQADAVVSHYKQYIRMGGICTLREYLYPPQDGRIPLFRLRNLEYHRLAGYYRELFGAGNVNVMLYEQFRDEPSAFLQQLADFLGVRGDIEFPTARRMNPSMSDTAILLKRLVNRWHGGDSLYPVTPPAPWLTHRLFKGIAWLDAQPWFRRLARDRQRQEASEALAGSFRASNRALADSFRLDLLRYGYEC